MGDRVLLRYQGPPGGAPGWSPGETRAVPAAIAQARIAANPTWWVVLDADVLERGVSCR